MTAIKWMLEGIREHELFQRAFLSAKEHALNAGIFFLSAMDRLGDGDWGLFLEGYSHKIPKRTVQRYVEFASEVLEWAKAQNPKLIGMEKLAEVAREMVLQSPKGLVALCRELKLMRKFGEYDEVKYRKQKLIGNSQQQFEFTFESIVVSLDVLTHFGDSNYTFNYPKGVDEVEFMSQVEAKLEVALARVREIKKNGRLIEA